MESDPAKEKPGEALGPRIEAANVSKSERTVTGI